MNWRQGLGRGVLPVLVAVVLGSGCAASAPGPEPEPVPTYPAAPGSSVMTLADLGVRNGPAVAVPLPTGLIATQVVDQENVVTVIVGQPAGAEFIAFLGDHLVEGGFTIEAETDQGIVFDGYGWNGGATGGETPALTLRRAPSS